MVSALFKAFTLFNFAVLGMAGILPVRPFPPNFNNYGRKVAHPMEARDDTMSCCGSSEIKPSRHDFLAAMNWLTTDNLNCGGPGGSMRVGCYGHAGLYIINDDNHPINLPCGVFASTFSDLATQCGAQNGNNNVCGSLPRVFEGNNYKALVKWTADCA